MVCHSLCQWITYCQTSPPWPVCLGWPHTTWLSFIELDKAVFCVIRLASFLWLWFQCVCPLMPSHKITEITETSFKKSHANTATLSAPNPAAGHCRPTPLLETPGHSRASLGQSLVKSLFLSPGSWCAQDSVCAFQESVSPVLCKFWWLYGGVNGDLLQEGLCHNQVCCTHSLCPCSRPLLIHTFSGDIQTQFWLSFCGVSGSWCAQGLFEPSEHLCRVRSLILNAILLLLPSCLGFSFALGHGVSFLVGSNIFQLMVVQ